MVGNCRLQDVQIAAAETRLRRESSVTVDMTVRTRVPCQMCGAHSFFDFAQDRLRESPSVLSKEGSLISG
jgi:hypothetical protein